MMRKFLMLLVAIGLPGQLWAVDISQVTSNLMAPTLLVTKLLILACYVVGVILIISAVAQYRNHRQTPKLVPLTTPVLLFIIGVALLLTPYFSTIVEESGSAVEQTKKSGKDQSPPSRLTGPKTPKDTTGPGSLPPDKTPSQSPQKPSGSKSWTDKYK